MFFCKDPFGGEKMLGKLFQHKSGSSFLMTVVFPQKSMMEFDEGNTMSMCIHGHGLGIVYMCNR